MGPRPEPTNLSQSSALTSSNASQATKSVSTGSLRPDQPSPFIKERLPSSKPYSSPSTDKTGGGKSTVAPTSGVLAVLQTQEKARGDAAQQKSPCRSESPSTRANGGGIKVTTVTKDANGQVIRRAASRPTTPTRLETANTNRRSSLPPKSTIPPANSSRPEMEAAKSHGAKVNSLSQGSTNALSSTPQTGTVARNEAANETATNASATARDPPQTKTIIDLTTRQSTLPNSEEGDSSFETPPSPAMQAGPRARKDTSTKSATQAKGAEANNSPNDQMDYEQEYLNSQRQQISTVSHRVQPLMRLGAILPAEAQTDNVEEDTPMSAAQNEAGGLDLRALRQERGYIEENELEEEGEKAKLEDVSYIDIMNGGSKIDPSQAPSTFPTDLGQFEIEFRSKPFPLGHGLYQVKTGITSHLIQSGCHGRDFREVKVNKRRLTFVLQCTSASIAMRVKKDFTEFTLAEEINRKPCVIRLVAAGTVLDPSCVSVTITAVHRTDAKFIETIDPSSLWQVALDYALASPVSEILACFQVHQRQCEKNGKWSEVPLNEILLVIKLNAGAESGDLPGYRDHTIPGKQEICVFFRAAFLDRKPFCDICRDNSIHTQLQVCPNYKCKKCRLTGKHPFGKCHLDAPTISTAGPSNQSRRGLYVGQARRYC